MSHKIFTLQWEDCDR